MAAAANQTANDIEPGGGPTTPIAVARREELCKILSRKSRPGLNIPQLVADLECLDVLRNSRPDWVKQLENTGFVQLRPATLAETIPEQMTDKKTLERMRDGLTALERVFDRLPEKKQNELAHAAFVAAGHAAQRIAQSNEKEAGSGAALVALLEHLLIFT